MLGKRPTSIGTTPWPCVLLILVMVVVVPGRLFHFRRLLCCRSARKQGDGDFPRVRGFRLFKHFLDHRNPKFIRQQTKMSSTRSALSVRLKVPNGARLHELTSIQSCNDISCALRINSFSRGILGYQVVADSLLHTVRHELAPNQKGSICREWGYTQDIVH